MNENPTENENTDKRDTLDIPEDQLPVGRDGNRAKSMLFQCGAMHLHPDEVQFPGHVIYVECTKVEGDVTVEVAEKLADSYRRLAANIEREVEKANNLASKGECDHAD